MESLGSSAQGRANPPPSITPGQAETNTAIENSGFLLDGYAIGEQIGEGGMATVYRGTQLSLLRPVAIKMLNQHMAKHSQVYEAFEREAVIIARLNHPNIIHVIDRGIRPAAKSDHGQPFFIMEYVDGIDLARLMTEGQLPLQKKLDICVQICKALSYAHKNSVIHRDVKPGNILVDQDFNVKVLDFGIALFYGSSQSIGTTQNTSADSIPPPQTHADSNDRSVMGTLNYMAPELNASAAKATALSDIYSLGVIMFELFAGHLPSQAQRLKPHRETPLPASVAPLIMRCLSPEPEKRPRSMIDLHDQLLVLLRGSHLDKKRVKRANDSINNRKTFSLLDIIREDGNSAVYLFIERNSGNQIIVKKTAGDYCGFETGKQLSQLSHRNIVRVHGTSKNERAFIVVMDYQRGGSLQERLAQPYGIDKFIPVARQILSALAFVHRHHIIHGNLRPSNILFDENDVVKVSDFGLNHHDSGQQNTKQQAPARVFAVNNEPLCPQSDLYACGVIFHLMLLGALPRHQNGQLQTGRAFRRLPDVLQAVLKGLLVQQLASRYRDANTVIQELEKQSQYMPTQVWNTEVTLATGVTNKRARKGVLLLLLLAAVLIGIVKHPELVNVLSILIPN